jgi:hypothetical protein
MIVSELALGLCLLNRFLVEADQLMRPFHPAVRDDLIPNLPAT